MKPRVGPVPLDRSGDAETVTLLPCVRDAFNDRFLWELLDDRLSLVPFERVRTNIGDLLCINREHPARSSAAIVHLLVSPGDYFFVAETKLWRIPWVLDGVMSQFLDYVKDVITRDFEWLEFESLDRLQWDQDEQAYFEQQSENQ